MKFRIAMLALSLCLTPAIGQTQSSLNEEAAKEYFSANEKLNKILNEIFRLYSKDKPFLAAAQKSQRHWVNFRNAQLSMKFPKRPTPGAYGSVLPMCKFYYLTGLTMKRCEELELWLKPAEEGDVCAGTMGRFPRDGD